MKKTIFLCASMSCYKELVEIEEELKKKGFQVIIPISAQIMKKKNDFEVSHFKDVFSHGEKAKFIHKNFQNIAKSDVILVVNGEKNGVQGYIGTNVLMEIALAFYLKKKIYIWNPINRTASYKEELDAFGVEIITKDMQKII